MRFEAKLPLYGQEIDQDITPLEAGLGFFVKLEAGDFIGRTALIQQKQEGLKRKLVEFSMLGKGIPRSHYEVEVDGMPVGHVSSGMYSPTFKKPIGLALLNIEHCEPGSETTLLSAISRLKPGWRRAYFTEKKTKI